MSERERRARGKPGVEGGSLFTAPAGDERSNRCRSRSRPLSEATRCETASYSSGGCAVHADATRPLWRLVVGGTRTQPPKRTKEPTAIREFRGRWGSSRPESWCAAFRPFLTARSPAAATWESLGLAAIWGPLQAPWGPEENGRKPDPMVLGAMLGRTGTYKRGIARTAGRLVGIRYPQDPPSHLPERIRLQIRGCRIPFPRISAWATMMGAPGRGWKGPNPSGVSSPSVFPP